MTRRRDINYALHNIDDPNVREHFDQLAKSEASRIEWLIGVNELLPTSDKRFFAPGPIVSFSGLWQHPTSGLWEVINPFFLASTVWWTSSVVVPASVGENLLMVNSTGSPVLVNYSVGYVLK